MLIVIPTSLASDVSDDGIVIESTDCTVLATSVDNVNIPVSANADGGDVVIGEGEDLVISTNPNNVTNYTIGTSNKITVNIAQSDKYNTYKNTLGTLYAYMDINGGEHTVDTFGGWYRSVNTYTTFSFDLNEIDSSYFNEGENTFKICVDTTKLDQFNLTYDFIPFTVYAQKATSKINTTITVSPEEMELKIGDSSYFTAILNPSSAGSLSYKSSDESVATVSSWGKVTAVGTGVANITISYPGNDLYNAAEINMTVTVPAPDYTSTPTVKGKDDVDYLIGENLTIDVEIIYLTEEEDYWKGYNLSGDNMYVFINGEAVKLDNIPSDTKNFTVNIADINYTFEPSKKYSLIFRPSNAIMNMANLDISDCILNTLTVYGREYTEDLVITTEPSTVDNYSLGSSKLITVNVEKSEKFRKLITSTLYAFIDMNNGNHTINYFDGWRRSVVTYNTWTFDLNEIDVSYFKVGENILNITVVTSNLDSNNLTYTFIPLVVNALEMTSKINTTITSNIDKIELETGRSTYFTATLTPSAAGELTYESSDESVATVSSWGRIAAVGPGVANITISYPGNDYYNPSEYNITVTVPVPVPEYTSTPTVNGKNATDYAIGENLTIDVKIDYLTEEEDYYKGYDLTGGNMHVYINGTAVKLDNIPSEVKNFTINISDINFTFESGESYSLIFHPSNSIMNMAYLDIDDCLFNTLTVTVVDEKYDGIIYVDLNGSDSNVGSEDKPVATIAKAIELATSESNTAHKIIIRKGTYEESGLAVASDLEIVGEDAVIDAANAGRILDITAGNVNISGITFANANVTGYGGAISIKGATVEVDNCTFVNNTATSGAGAILWDADDGKLSNSVFENNAGRNGAAVTIGSLGWSPKGDNTEITNCVFNNNDNIYEAAGCIGLAVYADNVKVTDSNFTNSVGHANSNHGTLYILGDDCEVSGCLFENNTMDGSGALQADGDYVNIHDNIFRNNMISGGIASRAGAIEIQSINAEITDNVFENNGGEDCREGGAINIVYVDYDGEITISGNEFINNSAAYGGAIYVDGGYSDTMGEFTLVISDNTFDGNVAGQGAGIYTYNTGDAEVTISDNTFKNQQATEGGAIYSEDSYIALSGNTMENCVAENGNDIYLEYGEVTTETNLVISEDASIKLGENVTVTATLTDDNNNTISGGAITLTANGEKLDELDVENGTVSFVFTPSEVGNYTISGSYDLASDVNIETALIEVINAEKQNATISIDAPEITEGENATVTVTLPEDATGNVTVGNEVADVINGTASVVLTNLPVGNNTLPVVYSGDDKYNPIETEINITVNPVSKKYLTLNATVFEVMGNASLIVTGFENATGNVTVTIGEDIYTTPIMMGMAFMSIPKLNETVTAYIYYPGDDNYNNASTTVEIIAKKDLNLTASADPIYVGQNATVIVTGFENATGNVMVIAGKDVYNATIIDAIVSVSIPGLNETTPAYIMYWGDDNYNMAFTSVNITVNPKENATISIDAPSEVTEGDNVTVTVILPEDATGTVTIGNEAVPVQNGTASAVLTNLPLGNNTVPITYSGDDKYNPIETSVNITVDEDKSDIIEAPDVTKYYKGSERFVVTVTDYKGKGIANKTVKININGVDYDRTTNANGTTSIALNLESGVYNVTTTVDNTTIDSVVTILTTVNGTDVVKVFRNDTQYYATFRDSQGNYLAQGSQVEFNINGVFYYRYTGDKGLAKLNLNLEQGTYILTARNLQTGEMSSNNITVLPRITENNDLTKYYRNASQYTVKIIGDDGKAVGAGENVTFNINGVLYTRTTNASGIAKLNINLEPGKYIITASYGGCNVANNITVLPVLSATDLTKKYGTPDQFVATLVDGQGNPYAGQNVTFNVHGVFYQRTTDSEGHAKLNINLMPGEYIITSSYNGQNVANTIKVEA
ncbi:Ig-like domain repeat protein [Methanobrevibacter sp.]|uniref:Ig-like domain repeat protein n=1 Tax=Methanobrevibacter sp. TaxID=66852 RepID=UPI00388CF5D3